ncbi:MAG: hypothetical protein EXR66_01280 [Dehalococcoidia bacterium]|nr:hypothetical protein [Dehalococcoidia bacterium]
MGRATVFLTAALATVFLTAALATVFLTAALATVFLTAALATVFLAAGLAAARVTFFTPPPSETRISPALAETEPSVRPSLVPIALAVLDLASALRVRTSSADHGLPAFFGVGIQTPSTSPPRENLPRISVYGEVVYTELQIMFFHAREGRPSALGGVRWWWAVD